MVDVAVSAQLQQWSFDKTSVVRPHSSDSTAPSPDPDMYDGETVRLDAAAAEHKPSLASSESIFQERYLSSEEDLSPMEHDDEESEEENEEDFTAEIITAKRMSIQVPKAKHGDMAVMVSIVSAGRPKIVDLPTMPSPIPGREKTERSASLAYLPPVIKTQLNYKPLRNSLQVPLSAPASGPKDSLFNPRPLARKPAFTPETSSLRVSSSSSSFADVNKSTSSLCSVASSARRPVSVTPSLAESQNRSNMPLQRAATMPFPPLYDTPKSPEPSFLSTDPFGNTSTTSASPIIKQPQHKRLRSISQKLSLAKIAVSTANKFTRGGTMPPTPSTPRTPTTPQTAPASSSTFSSPKARVRRSSTMIARGASEREPPLEIPPMPRTAEIKPRSRMVARAANERAPTIELPPFPDDDGADPVMAIKAKRIRKRKSLMDLL